MIFGYVTRVLDYLGLIMAFLC